MFRINTRSRQPLYEQLVENVIEMILNLALLKDEKLPSVRALANDLAINPNTIQKAYNQLEQQGIIYSRPGMGSFVALSADELGAKRSPDTFKMLDEVLIGLYQLHVPVQQVLTHVENFYNQQSEVSVP